MPGLDPGIPAAGRGACSAMDCRVEPDNDMREAMVSLRLPFAAEAGPGMTSVR
jgi:hypothetical protein